MTTPEYDEYRFHVTRQDGSLPDTYRPNTVVIRYIVRDGTINFCTEENRDVFTVAIQPIRNIGYTGSVDQLLSEDSGAGFDNMFNQVNVPSDYRDSLKFQIQYCIMDDLANMAHTMDNTNILIAVQMFAFTIGPPILSDTRNIKPASISSVEELERVRLEEIMSTDVDRTCSICLNEFLVEADLKRMPCSHIFHGACILQWLNKRHTCPLCRFEMPIDEN